MNDDILRDWRSLMEKGTVFLGQGDYPKAEKYYLRSLKLAKRLAIPVISAFNLRLLSTSRIKQGKVALAERGFKEALKICQQLQNYKGMSEAMAGLASVAEAQDKMEEAATWYEQAIQVYPLNSPRLRLSMLFSDLGQVYSEQENWDKAQYTFRKARELCHIYGYRKGEGELSILLAEVLYRQNKIQLARKDLLQSCKIFSEEKDEESLVNAIQYLAFINFEEENFAQAREDWQRVVVLYLRLAQWENVSESTYFLAKILEELRDFTEAVYYLKLSIEVYKHEDLGLGLRYQNLGQLQAMQKDYQAACANLKKAAELFEKYGEEQKLGEAYEKIALCLEQLGEIQESQEYHVKSKVSHESHQLISFSTNQRLAEYFENRRSYLNALQYYWQSLKIAQELGIETIKIEQAIQRISKKVRKRNKYSDRNWNNI
ncbi:hypothetical protein DESME_06465 [Desulfitobacterium metallireducens DSM 15288]|uniref:Uncharacterized protein n=2 Tax=Desulfitobacterium TaxID=36853 RepID=W0E7B4_9FIRM|nr:hypothetical protein DESME_06465 [Desulfitobacterium metallireducens DSM 15288]